MHRPRCSTAGRTRPTAGPVRSLDEPVRFGERAFTEGRDPRIGGLAPYRDLMLRDLVPRPAVFPDPASRSVRLRRTVLALPAPDAELVGRELAPLRPYAEAVDGHRAARRGA
ncbi:hypothetical protein ACLIYM_27005 [Streptomyces fenghuangensis]